MKRVGASDTPCGTWSSFQIDIPSTYHDLSPLQTDHLKKERPRDSLSAMASSQHAMIWV